MVCCVGQSLSQTAKVWRMGSFQMTFPEHLLYTRFYPKWFPFLISFSLCKFFKRKLRFREVELLVYSNITSKLQRQNVDMNNMTINLCPSKGVRHVLSFSVNSLHLKEWSSSEWNWKEDIVATNGGYKNLKQCMGNPWSNLKNKQTKIKVSEFKVDPQLIRITYMYYDVTAFSLHLMAFVSCEHELISCENW